MKYLFLLIWIVNINCSYGQQNYDSLRKYSYCIRGYTIEKNGVIPTGGTCFFIKRNDKLFLITAYHVICGTDDNDNKIKNYPKELTVFTFDSVGNLSDYFFSISIKSILDTCRAINSFVEPDIIAIEINNNNRLRTVEKFIKPPFQQPGQVIMFGFPGLGDLTHPSGWGIIGASNLNIDNRDSQIITHTKYEDGTLDSINYYINTENKNDTFFSKGWYKGYSGSPVFIKDKVTKTWRLGGVFAFSLKKDNNDIIIGVPKIEMILRRIDLLYR